MLALYTLSIIFTVKFGLSEEHSKFEKNLPHGLYIYLVNVQTMRKIFSHFECFPESPNFTEKFQPPSIMKLLTKDVSYFIFFIKADVLHWWSKRSGKLLVKLNLPILGRAKALLLYHWKKGKCAGLLSAQVFFNEMKYQSKF